MKTLQWNRMWRLTTRGLPALTVALAAALVIMPAACNRTRNSSSQGLVFKQVASPTMASAAAPAPADSAAFYEAADTVVLPAPPVFVEASAGIDANAALEGPPNAPLPPEFTGTLMQPTDDQVLTSGPVHEAFGEPIAYDAQPGAVVTQEPPAPVQEEIPDLRPDGENIVWIPGYWAWDDNLDGFLWVSGLWRAMPPDCQWVPGYWTPAVGGFQWVSGFWQTTATQTVVYLPAPPASQEIGPTSAAPDVDYIWEPGYWDYGVTVGYTWCAGSWMHARPDRVWVPAHYQWTPRGYIFIRGHWDFPMDCRGVIFAPVRFGGPVVLGHRPIIFHPTVVIDTHGLGGCLFSDPRHNRYVFGDYFDARNVNRGIRPWLDGQGRSGWYDPMLAHERWSHQRTDPKWEQTLRTDFQYRTAHADARPALTLAAQKAGQLNKTLATKPMPVLAKPLTTMAAAPTGTMKFSKVTAASRAQLTSHEVAINTYAAGRAKVETAPKPATTTKVPTLVKIPTPGTKTPTAPVKAPTTTAKAPVTNTTPPTMTRTPDTTKTPPVATAPRTPQTNKTIPTTPVARTPVTVKTAPTTTARSPETVKTYPAPTATRTPEVTRSEPPVARTPETIRTAPTPTVRAPETVKIYPAPSPVARTPDTVRTAPTVTARTPETVKTYPAPASTRTPEATRSEPPVARTPVVSRLDPTPVRSEPPAVRAPVVSRPDPTPVRSEPPVVRAPAPAPVHIDPPAARAPEPVRSEPAPAPHVSAPVRSDPPSAPSSGGGGGGKPSRDDSTPKDDNPRSRGR
jgi:hypothetical protein